MPQWEYRVNLDSLDRHGSFPEFRDAAVKALRDSEWYRHKSAFPRLGMQSLADLSKVLADTTDERSYAEVFDGIYDLADIDRAWIEVS